MAIGENSNSSNSEVEIGEGKAPSPNNGMQEAEPSILETMPATNNKPPELPQVRFNGDDIDKTSATDDNASNHPTTSLDDVDEVNEDGSDALGNAELGLVLLMAIFLLISTESDKFPLRNCSLDERVRRTPCHSEEGVEELMALKKIREHDGVDEQFQNSAQTKLNLTDVNFSKSRVGRKERKVLRRHLKWIASTLSDGLMTLLPHVYCLLPPTDDFMIVKNILPKGLEGMMTFKLQASNNGRQGTRFTDLFPEGFLLERDDLEKILSTLKTDCKHLQDANVVGYSLSLGLVPVSQDLNLAHGMLNVMVKDQNGKSYVAFMGIVDVLKTDDWKRRGKRFIRRCICCVSDFIEKRLQ
ncbi:hypothetical protein CAPTEDRAFT_218201 [Capitella teleta]|uniref:PIPK domain-containing protein n=1 Tax=Capitella teleta TaxID=283909 RepID=R7TLG8_CAPTE|nr:hypothetical protein CAPTEDRAFT_218201 [Capitella teleta]|eukprot:ELT94688.1 hypothetical protein CAPTEDRAFT_218201 [Capitella teleta]